MPWPLLLLLRCVTDPALADAIAGDLTEERCRRARRASAMASRLWLWRAAIGIAAVALAAQLSAAARRRSTGGGPVQRFRSDLRHSWRALRLRSGSTAAAVLVLAVGIGLTSAMFALADPFLFRPLPYADPDRLVVIDLNAENRLPGPFPTLEEWQARTDLFTGVSAFSGTDINTMRVRLPDADAMMATAMVDETFFDVLGLPLALPDDWDAAAGRDETPVVLLADADTRLTDIFAASPNQSVARQDGGTVRLVGSMPRRFLFPRNRVVPTLNGLAPLPAGPLMEVTIRPGGFSSTSRQVIARLAPGVTAEVARSVLNPPESDQRAYSLDIEPVRAHLTAGLEPLALGAFLAGLLIVLVSAANVSNLLLARGVWRAREFATRGALGASRLDLARLVLVELSLLTAIGVAAGLLVTQFALLAVQSGVPAEYVALGTPAVTARVVLFAAAIGATVMIAGTVPAFAAWGLAPASLLAHTSATESRGVRVLRFAMAAGQTTVAMILVAGAALLGRSYLNLVGQNTGFDGNAVVVAASYPEDLRGVPLSASLRDTEAALAALPAVSTAGIAVGSMIDSMVSGSVLRVDGSIVRVGTKNVTPTYFDAAGSRLVAGRTFAEAGEADVAILNETVAGDLWPNESAIGQTLPWGAASVTVVGVVQDSFDLALDEAPGRMIFTPLSEPRSGFRINYIVRASESAAALAPRLRRAVVDVNRDAIVTDVSTLGSRLATSVDDRTFATLVLSFFAVAGVGVCAAGLVGIVTFVVARRTREIAIRTAIGATPSHVRRLVTRQAMTAAMTGIVVGIVAGRWLSIWLESLLYGVEAGDWLTLAIAAVIVMAIVVLASWLPARRALRLSPTIALRAD